MDAHDKIGDTSHSSILAEDYVEFRTLDGSDGDDFRSKFDEVSSEDNNLMRAMTISLESIGGIVDDHNNLINLAGQLIEKIDPKLNQSFGKFIIARTKQAFLYDDDLSMPITEDEDASSTDETDSSFDLLEAIDKVHGGDRVATRMELICKTGAFPIDSNETLCLVALCACLPNGDPDVAGDYFKALALYISRTHDLRSRRHYSKDAGQFEANAEQLEANTRIAKDIVMLWFFYRHCLVAALEGKLRCFVEPDWFIGRLYQARPLFVISDTEYRARLAKCGSHFPIMQCFRVYGNGDAGRKAACRDAIHAYWRQKRRSRYSRYGVDRFFEDSLSSKSKITGLRNVLETFTLKTDTFHPRFQLQLKELAIKHGEEKGLIAHVTPDESYKDTYVRDLPMDKPVIMLRAACGTGKSVEMLRYIDRLDKDSVVVIVTHRKALSAELEKRTRGIKGREPFVLYSDIDGKIDLNHHRNVICEYESLSRVLPYHGKFCVIIDEVNSVLFQTQSGVGDTQGAHAVFVNLMNSAFRVLLMDAFLDQDRVDVLKHYVKGEPYVIENTYKPNFDHQIWHTTNKNTAKQRLLRLIEDGENVVVPCTLKSDAEEIYQLVCELVDPKFVLIFTAEERWQNGDDINEVWSKARVVIHTSTMDSGHSFERDHFGWCVCFFSNQVQIPVEGCLQMKARSRLTKRFVICIEHRPTSKEITLSSIEDYIAHIQKNNKEMAETSCRNYYGENRYWSEYKGGYPVCPFLFLYASLQMLTQRSYHNYTALLFQLLREDGVPTDNFRMLEGDGSEIEMAVKKAREEAKKHTSVPNPLALMNIYTDTSIDVFESMTEDKRRFYGDKKIIQAYLNTRALKMEGNDFHDAIRNAQEKQAQLFKAISLCRSTKKFTADSILQTEIQLGLHSVNNEPGRIESSFLRSVLIGSELSKIFTGEENPFCTPPIDASQLRNNLLCSCSNLEEDSGYIIHEIDPDLSRTITDLCNLYHSISGNERHYPARAKSYQLTVTEGLTLANKVFKLQFGLELKRTSRRKTTKEKNQEYIYEIQDLFHAEQGSDQKKPTMITWSSRTKDEELLHYKKVGGGNILVVCLGPAFNHWPGNSPRHGYIPIGPECFDTARESKKRKLESDTEGNSKIKMKRQEARKRVTQKSRASAERSLLEYFSAQASSGDLSVNSEPRDQEDATRMEAKPKKRRRRQFVEATQESIEWMNTQKASVVCNRNGNSMGWNISQYWPGR